MKNKFLIINVLIIISVFTVNTYALGRDGYPANAQLKNQDKEKSTSTISDFEDCAKEGNPVMESYPRQCRYGDQTFTEDINKKQEDQDEDQTQGSSTTSTNEKINTERHHSMVLDFTRILLKTASTTEDKTGEKIRVIAREQNESASTTIQVIETVQIRSKIKTFFFGTDYKNLGELRSEVSHTRNRLNELNRLLGNATNTTSTEINAQIKSLEQEQIKIEDFIKTQESKFSLFGWLIKAFSK